MTKPIEVITSVQRRRRWSRAEKERIVTAAIEPGAVASEVARAAGIYTSQARGRFVESSLNQGIRRPSGTLCPNPPGKPS